MTEQHKVTPEQWDYITAGASHRDLYSSCILELRARVEALEATQHTHLEQIDAKSAPADSLVAQLRGIIGLHPVADGKTRAVLRATAVWLREREYHWAAAMLEQEANRG